MGSVLIVHERGELPATIAQELRTTGHTTRHVCSRDEALASLAAAPVDVLLCDAPATAGAGPDELMQAFRRAAPRAALVLLVGDEGAAELAAPWVLRPPHSPQRIAERVRGAIAASRGFLGSVSGFALVEVLQMFHLARRTASLRIEGATPGSVEFERGEVVHATCGAVTGVDAVRQLLASPGGSFGAAPRAVPDVRTIDRAFDVLLMDALRDAAPGDGSAVDAAPGSAASDWLALASEPSAAIAAIAAPAGPASAPLAARWRAACATLGERGVALLVDERAGGAVTVLRGSSGSARVVDAVRALGRGLGALARGGPSGVLEYHAGRVAAALLWSRADRATLVLGDAVDPQGAAWFRAYVAAMATRVLAREGERGDGAATRAGAA